MTRLGWTLVGGGFMLQLLIPLNALDLSESSRLGIPGPLLGIFIASGAMVAGILLVYRFWYKGHAINVDTLE